MEEVVVLVEGVRRMMEVRLMGRLTCEMDQPLAVVVLVIGVFR